MLIWLVLCAITGAESSWRDDGQAELEIMNEWSVFDWTPQFHGYNPKRAIPVSLEVTSDRIFLAIPRLYSGLPASLAVIPRNRPSYGVITPKLQAWPNIGWHTGANCSSTMVSVFRMRLDRCDRLWVLDSGVANTFENWTVQCPPKILIFDINTDALLRLVVVPEELVRRNSVLTNIVIDDQYATDDNCDSGLTVYMSDVSSPSIIVYSPLQDSMWRLSHPYMYPDPEHGVYTVEGESFTLMDGILGLALTPPAIQPKRLFFQPFASDRIFSIETSALQQGPNPGDDSALPVKVEGRKSSQAAGMIFNPRDNALYFSPVTEESLVAWNPGSSRPRIVAHNREMLQFVLDMRSPRSDHNNMWLISTKLQKFVKQDVDLTVPHIRIIRVKNRYGYYNNTIY